MLQTTSILEKNTYPYLTAEEIQFIQSLGMNRFSLDSRKNLCYILGNFSNFIKQPLFLAGSSDASAYANFLLQKIQEKLLKESYCCCIFYELRSFYEIALNNGMVDYNPFTVFKNPFKIKTELDSNDLPSLADVDLLLTLLRPYPKLHLTALLALRMTCSVSNILEIKKKDLCFDQAAGELFLRRERIVNKKKETEYLLIPEDLIPFLEDVYQSTAASFPYLLEHKPGKPYTYRTLNRHFKSVQTAAGLNINLSQLRSLGMFLLLVEKVPVDQIAAFSGIKGVWLNQYKHIPAELKDRTAELMNIRIL